MPWEDFRDQYSRLKVATFRSVHARDTAEIRLDLCESIIKPRTLGDMAKPATLARLQAELLAGEGGKRRERDEDGKQKPKRPRSPHTVRSYMATLLAALNWAFRPMKHLPERIEFDLIDCDDPDKGRPITTEEFERMLAAIPKVVGEDKAESWRYLLRGMWESGLRRSEAMRTAWDTDGAIIPHFSRNQPLPVLHIPAKMQKNRRAQDVPTTPAFAALLEETPVASRTGWIFNPSPRRGTGRLSVAQAGRIISKIGRKALVVVNANGKAGSSHDFRRSFGQRMADAGLPPRDLMSIMRHSSMATTERYYLRDRVQDQATRIATYLGTGGKQEKREATEEIDVSR
jgi:integrase